MRKFKFRAWHPKANRMIDFGLDKYSLETITQKIKKIDLGNGYSIDSSTLKPSSLYLRGYFLERKDELPLITLIDMEDPDLVIMQYLGEDCKDCNGIELCEGDIVKYCGSEIEIGTITYKGHGYRMEYFIRGHYHFVGNYDFKWNRLEKIGNIYQTPELLNDHR
jgi:hypothetical protein